MADSDAKKHVYLIDGSAYIFRAFYGLPPMNRADGTPVNAVFGFCSMLMGLLEGNKADYFAVIFDAARKNFRNDFYPDYKGHRPDAPEELKPQFPLIREATRAFNLPCLEIEGYEADDLIATYAKIASDQNMRVTVVSSDKDLMQLVNDRVSLWDPVKNKIIDYDGVVEKFGVPPNKVIEVQALSGDSADNVPGVPGIGPKTATELIKQYGDLENLLSCATQIKQPKRRQSLIDFADQARISKRLVTLDEAVPLDVGLDDLGRKPIDRDQVKDFFEAQGFRRLLSRLGAPHQSQSGRDESMRPAGRSFHPPPTAPADTETNKDAFADIAYGDYELITTQSQLERWCERVKQAGMVAIDTETTGLHIMQDRLVGISLAAAVGKAAYIPLTHNDGAIAQDLFAEDQPAQDHIKQNQLALALVQQYLNPIFEDSGILKIGHNLKFDLSILEQAGFSAPCPLDDTMLISFSLQAGLTGHGMDKLAKRHLQHDPISFESVVGKGAKMIGFDKVPLDQACAYAAEDADVTLRLWHHLKPKLRELGLCAFYEGIERPLIAVLSRMEQAGIKINVDRLKALDADFGAQMEILAREIYELAGEEFNIGSPKQMGEILFGKLQLPAANKTGGGALSTNVAVLEPLAETYPIAAKILDWRGFAKLRNTYCQALIDAANPVTKRVHTAFSMVGAQTGRLSSSDPNLQNIPIRTEAGRKIRSAFIAEAGYKIISLDYSQIELRLLAEIANIGSLRQAFLDDLDIHAATAAEVFDVALDQVDGELRRKAKAINFGIVYGISAFGLAKQIHVSNKEAKDFIDRYFQKFPGIRAFMDQTIQQCQHDGYVETLFGRRIHIPTIQDSNKAKAQAAQRQAINAPIQGSAADVIKRAMNKMPAALAKAGFAPNDVRMLLQVHDELIFEIKDDLCTDAIEIIRGVMENASLPLKPLSIPLKVEAGIADNWSAAH
ncbi:MAG: DNA polymerase I [Alphaproteobacteria bacterium]